MIFVSLRSSSSGNGYLLSDGQTTLMFDAGAPYPLIEQAQRAQWFPRPSVLFLSHEHSDHTRFLGGLHKAMAPAVIATAGTAAALADQNIGITPLPSWGRWLVGAFCITLVPKPHDAAEPVAFHVEHTSGVNVGLVLDLGHPAETVVRSFLRCHLLLIESNYDPAMLRQGPYPLFLKRRIAGRRGHLSNQQCRDFLKAVWRPQLAKVVLGHLSQENNAPALAYDLARRAMPPQVEVQVAPRLEPLWITL